jgi:hypothetical protein
MEACQKTRPRAVGAALNTRRGNPRGEDTRGRRGGARSVIRITLSRGCRMTMRLAGEFGNCSCIGCGRLRCTEYSRASAVIGLLGFDIQH